MRRVGNAYGVGVASMLLVSVVLCLTILGVLSLLNARHDKLLAERSVEATTAYYAAQQESARLLQALDEQIFEARRVAQGDEARFWAEIGDLADADGLATLTCEAGDGRVLTLAVRILPPDSARRYAIERHQLSNESEWLSEGSLMLFGSEE